MQARYSDSDLVRVEVRTAPLAACILWMLEHPNRYLIDGEGRAWMWATRESTFIACDGEDPDMERPANPAHGEEGIVLPCKPATGSGREDEE